MQESQHRPSPNAERLALEIAKYPARTLENSDQWHARIGALIDAAVAPLREAAEGVAGPASRIVPAVPFEAFAALEAALDGWRAPEGGDA